jgi:hypothetical protein
MYKVRRVFLCCCLNSIFELLSMKDQVNNQCFIVGSPHVLDQIALAVRDLADIPVDSAPRC